MTHETVTQKPHFDLVRRGYEPGQVDGHVTKLRREIDQLTANLRQERDFARSGSQQLVAERDAAVRQLRATQEELDRLRGQFAETTVEITPQKDEISMFGERLQTILATAEHEANAAKTEAMQAADSMLGTARQEAQAMRAKAEQEAERLLADARREAETARTEARQEAESGLAEARRQAAQLTEEATAEADRVTGAAHKEAAAKLDAARRDESQVRANLAELVQRREQVRRELTQIGAALESLLGDDVVAAAVAAADETSAGQPNAAQPNSGQPAQPAPGEHRPASQAGGEPAGSSDDTVVVDARSLASRSGAEPAPRRA